ncbi:retrovirus-related pol polyprotein from transposon TNT 1-94 [Tanacetum coccineum]
MAGNGTDVVVPLESIRAISKRFVNTTYGFFLVKRVAYSVVANYVKNTWSKYGLVKSMLNSSISPKDIGSDVAKNFKNPSQAPTGVRLFLSGNKKKDAESTKEVSNPNPFDVLNSVENDVELDDEGKPLEKVDYSGDHDGEDEVEPVDNEMASFMASKRVGYGQEIPDNIQSICDNSDIKIARAGNGVGVAISMESVCVVHERISNTWSKYDLIKSTMVIKSMFFFKFISKDMIDPMIKNGPSTSIPFDALDTVENDDELGMNAGKSKLVKKGAITDVVSYAHRTSSEAFDKKLVLVDDDDKPLKASMEKENRAGREVNDACLLDDEDFDFYDGYEDQVHDLPMVKHTFMMNLTSVFVVGLGNSASVGVISFLSQRYDVGEPDPEYVSLEDLTTLAMNKIEDLSVEGLRIQSGMSDKDALSNISPQSIGEISALEGGLIASCSDLIVFFSSPYTDFY